MAAITTAMRNWIVGFVVSYTIVSRLRSRRAGLMGGLFAGWVSAVTTFVVARRSAENVTVEIEDAPEAQTEAPTAD